ncbi:MAG: flagellar filament capping protein FliD [Pseudomonas sp.]|jgi:flagellar hook-associated protein 2|uniref:flagellar filament capping protein FliD n=1 Tax=Pseudomonas sp. TaxID=306 RepID=UPI00238E7F36|nr:flagellar filament capping protein FliD [Pseudomonas sp.]MDP9062203.1 flagellar filament capping protein FliD [Pseudomonadota bacterium]MDE1912110.1 flagellar filament capping protein FliD [Pseudomonas sp.]MDE2032041.1 flagellar filament capping protein FliD [Pseudomonas sp.]MDE2191362.1 flagellar filament capping protein FliD [Pseudomonas sp.]MDE2554275.1 flagellar filament capping protein FliD [Pseudomonas sp.]|eukprot:gene8866-10396_t
MTVVAGLTVNGPGTGIDVQGLVKSLVGAQTAPKQAQIDSQTKTSTAQLTSIGKIQAALDAFRGALDTMTKTVNFSGLSSTLSNDKLATVTLGPGAAAGNFTLGVTQLATASKVSTAVIPGGPTAVVNSGVSATVFTVSQSGKNYSVSVPPGGTLQQVRDSLNSQYGNAGLSANILTDSNGSRLVVTSSTTGVGSDITFKGSSGLDTGATVVGSAPQNAIYNLDGSPQESKSNTLPDAISGVSITLTGVSGTDAPSTIKVSANSATLKSAVKGFTDTYSALVKAVNAETQVTTNADGSVTPGPLTGDSSVRSMMASIRNVMNSVTGSGSFSSLAQFGVTTDQTAGTLSVSDVAFDKAALTNGSDINSIFTGPNGLLASLTNATANFALSKTGVFAEKSSTLQDNLKDLTNQQTALNTRSDALTASLTLKYNAMDSLVAQLKAQGDSVMTTLNSLNNPKST